MTSRATGKVRGDLLVLRCTFLTGWRKPPSPYGEALLTAGCESSIGHRLSRAFVPLFSLICWRSPGCRSGSCWPGHCHGDSEPLCPALLSPGSSPGELTMMRLATLFVLAAGLAVPAMAQTAGDDQHGHPPPENQGGQKAGGRAEPEAHRRGRRPRSGPCTTRTKKTCSRSTSG